MSEKPKERRRFGNWFAVAVSRASVQHHYGDMDSGVFANATRRGFAVSTRWGISMGLYIEREERPQPDVEQTWRTFKTTIAVAAKSDLVEGGR
jgi:hypothetical protein